MGLEAAAWFVVKLAAAYAISYVLRPDMPDIEGPRLDSLAVQASTYGKPIPKVYGSVRMAGNIIWSDGIREHEDEEDMGGKGGGGGTYTQYTYTCSFAVGLCAGPIAGIKRIWADSKLIYERSSSGWDQYRNIPASMAKSYSLAVYLGTEDQLPDPLMESIEGSGNVPGYRGLAYVVFENMRLEDFGNRIPNLEFEIATGSEQSYVTLTNANIHAATISGLCTSGSGVNCKKMWFVDNHFIVQTDDGFRDFDIFDRSGRLVSSIRDDGRLFLPAVYKQGGTFIAIGRDRDTNNLIKLDLFSGWVQVDTTSDVYRNASLGWWGEDNAGSGFSDEFGYYVYFVQNTATKKITVFKVARSESWFTGIFDNPVATYECNYFIGQTIVYNDYLISMNSYDGYLYVTRWRSLPNYEARYYARYTDGYVNGIAVNEQGDLMVLTSGLTSLGASHSAGILVMDGISGTPKKITRFLDGDETPANLDQIAADIFTRAGLTADQYDVTALAGDTCIGYAQTGLMTGADLLKPLMRTYQFDIVEIDWKLACKKRGSAVVADIPLDQLGAHEYGSNPVEPLTETITAEAEMPVEMILQYWDYDAFYQPNTETARRSPDATSSNNKVELDFPIVMKSTQALRAVETLFATTWEQRRRYRLSVPTEYIELAPGDVITLDNGAYKLLVDNATLSFPNLLTLDCFAEEPESYLSDSVGQSPHANPQPAPAVVSTIYPVFLHIPGLDAPTDQAGFYVAAYTIHDAFTPSMVYLSTDNGYSWRPVVLIEAAATVGQLTAALGSGPDTIIDEGNSLNVEILTFGRTLAGVSKLDLFSGSNTAAIVNPWDPNDDQVEIIGFQTVTEEADGTYTLSSLIRGRLGTNYSVLDATGNPQSVMATNAAGDRLVLLESGRVFFVPIAEEFWETTLKFKVVPYGGSLQSATIYEIEIQGANLRPYSPVHVTGTRNGAGDLTISWVRRSRSSAGWGYSETPLLETSEQYEIDIYNGTAVVRTITVTAATETVYTAADQTTDFGSAQAQVILAIHQMSEKIGRGYPATVTL